MIKPRARDLGLHFSGVTGPDNAITDIPGVLVGNTTRIEGDGPLVSGSGPVRTGVTAILPRGFDTEPMPVWAGTYALNGNGEMTGSHWIKDGGYFLGPICLTNTHSVGMVHHAATRWMIDHYQPYWSDMHLWAMPVVAETYDGILNDVNGQHITQQDTLAAINSATPGPLSEGNSGGGTGMVCYEFKGGTGSSSRLTEIKSSSYTVAALVQANHGIRPWFTALGVPVGKHLTDHRLNDNHQPEQGSIIVILATDAPLLPHQLDRLARRAAIGVGRGGSPGGNSSGDIFLAFSTANPQPIMQKAASVNQLQMLNDHLFDPLYLSAVEVVEESVINAMVAADAMTTLRPAGNLCHAIDHTQLTDVMRRYGRCD